MSDDSDESADTEKTNLTHLPLDVLRLVFEFCEGSNSLTATNRYFYNVRRHLYLRLSRKYSLEYYEDEDFRTLICSRVENPSVQLSLDLRDCRNITDVSALGGVHTLDLSECEKITDVSALGGVHTLDLRGCSNITDVSALGGVHILDLSECEKITDVSALGGVHDLRRYINFYN